MQRDPFFPSTRKHLQAALPGRWAGTLGLLATMLLGALSPIICSAEAAMPVEFPAEAQALSDQQLKERLSGHSFKASLKDGTGWRLQFKGGYIFVDISSGARDTGTWNIKDGKLCTEYQKFPSGCSEVRSLVKDVYLKRGSSGEIVHLERND